MKPNNLQMNHDSIWLWNQENPNQQFRKLCEVKHYENGCAEPEVCLLNSRVYKRKVPVRVSPYELVG